MISLTRKTKAATPSTFPIKSKGNITKALLTPKNENGHAENDKDNDNEDGNEKGKANSGDNKDASTTAKMQT